MRQAEKDFKFRSLVANERAARFDEPPQTRPRSVLDQMSDSWTDAGGQQHESHWMYPEVAQEMIRDMRAAGELEMEL